MLKKTDVLTVCCSLYKRPYGLDSKPCPNMTEDIVIRAAVSPVELRGRMRKDTSSPAWCSAQSSWGSTNTESTSEAESVDAVLTSQTCLLLRCVRYAQTWSACLVRRTSQQ